MKGPLSISHASLKFEFKPLPDSTRLPHRANCSLVAKALMYWAVAPMLRTSCLLASLILLAGQGSAVRTAAKLKYRGTSSDVSRKVERPSNFETTEGGNAAKDKFTQIYSSKYWSSAGGGSGSGSTREMTIGVVSAIRLVANRYALQSLIDTPCGAFTWQPLLLQLLEDDFQNFTYTGVDVVEHVIQDNRQRYANKSNWNFLSKDLSSEEIPSGHGLLLSRDALQHLPCKTAVDMLRNIAKSNPDYLLLGSYDTDANEDIPIGAYYPINLRKAPFSMQGGLLQVFKEHNTMINPGEPDKDLLLFSGSYTRSLDYDSMLQACELVPVRG